MVPCGVDLPHDVHEAVDRHGGQAQGQLVDHEQLGAGHHAPGPGPASAARRPTACPPAGGAGGELGEAGRGPRRWPPGPAGPAARSEYAPSCRLSRTVSPGKVIFPPTSRATPWSMICSGSRKVQLTPKIRITPRWGCSSPATVRSRVDLPAPLVPSRATISPSATSRFDVEEHLVGPVEEVEVVDLQRGDRPPGLAAPALGVALEDVLDDHGDVPPARDGTRRAA